VSVRLTFALVPVALAGCVSSTPAPVVERNVPARSTAAAPPPVAAPVTAPRPRPVPSRADTRPESYTVKPGDTLYSIALEHGLDYRELALWNGLDNPGAIRVGMQLRLNPPAGAPTVVVSPLKGSTSSVEGRPLGTAPAAAPPAAPASADARPEPKADSSETARGPEDVEWAWPVKGKVVGTFNDSTSKGIAIAGKLGQPVLASAPGRVIFSGTGIRGFGKLVVIKHNNTYLSVYAHNSELNVKEGQTVTRGQKIAEMGNTDADQVKLHFEIRRFGKPVDPLKLLPSG
jgi:lipoprotein NlpD